MTKISAKDFVRNCLAEKPGATLGDIRKAATSKGLKMRADYLESAFSASQVGQNGAATMPMPPAVLPTTPPAKKRPGEDLSRQTATILKAISTLQGVVNLLGKEACLQILGMMRG